MIGFLKTEKRVGLGFFLIESEKSEAQADPAH